MSDNLCFKEVHTNMKFNSNSTNYSKDKVIRTWHPTLCSTLDYHYIYRIGGGDPLKGLFGESSNNVDYFDLYSMTNKKLPPMKHQRAKCSATILPPNIPFHDYQEIEEEIQDNSAPNLNQLFIEQFKKPRVPPPPMPPIVNMNLDISMDDLLSELNESEQNDQHDDDQEDDETEKEDNKNTNKTQQTTDDKDTETNTNTNTETEQDDNVNIPNGNHTEKEHTKEPEQEEVKQEETQSLHLNGDASPLPNNKEQKPSPTNLSPNISPDTSPQPNVDDGNKSPANLSPNIGPKRVIVKKKMPTTPPPPKPVPKLPPSPNVAPLAPPNGPSNISPNGSPNISPNISPNLAPNKSPSPKQQPIVIVDSTSSPSSTPPQTSPTNSPKSAKIIPPVLNGNAAPLPKGIAAAPPPVISSSNGAAPMPSLPIAPPMAPPIAPPINSIIGNKGTKTVSISSNIPNGNETNSNEPSVNYGGRSRRNSHKSRSESEYPEYCLFVSGGLNGSKLHKKCEIFYPFENSWNPIMSMKQARCGHIAQYMGQTQWKRTVTPSNINGNHLNISMDILEWKDISDLTTKVFVCGGRREHGNGITSCEVYDIENNKWKMCQRAPFTNHGYQSGCWWSNKQCVAMISDPMDGNQIALYKPDINKWNIVGQSNNNKSKQNLKPNNFLQNQPRNDMNLIHFYPLIGTLYLFGQEYLYIMGDDYKFKSLEIYDERANKWIPIGIEYKTLKDDDSIQQKHDQLLKLTNFKQFDSFYSVS